MEGKVDSFFDWNTPSYIIGILVSFNLLYLILFVLQRSLISVFFWALFSLLLLCWPLCLLTTSGPPPGLSTIKSDGSANSPENANGTTTDSAPSSAAFPTTTPREEIISQETIEQWLWYLYDQINDWGAELRRLILWHDATSSFIALLTCAFIAHVSAGLNLSVPLFLYFAVHGTFAYIFLQKFYNHVLLTLWEKVKQLINSIPRYSKLHKI